MATKKQAKKKGAPPKPAATLPSSDGRRFRGLKTGGIPAEKLPGLIAALASSDASTRYEALQALHASLYTPGRVFSATPVAIEALIEGLGSPDAGFVERSRVMMLIVETLTLGDHEPLLRTGLDLSIPVLKKQYASGPAKDVYRAVADRSQAFIGLLRDQDPTVRAGAAFVLGFLCDGADVTLAALVERLATEPDAFARGSIVLALAYVGRYAKQAKAIGAKLEASRSNDGSGLVRGLAVVGLAHLTNDAGVVTKVKTTHADLRDLFAQSRFSGIEYPSDPLPWHWGRVDLLAIQTLGVWRTEGRKSLTVAMLDVIVEAEAFAVDDRRRIDWPAFLLDWHFPSVDFFEKAPTVAALKGDLKTYAEKLSTQELGGPFVDHGMPPDVRARRRWLRLDPEGILERVVTATLARKREWPIWRVMHVLVEDPPEDAPEEIVAAAQKYLPKLDRAAWLDIWGEVGAGAYGLDESEDALYDALEAAGDAALPWARRMIEEVLRFPTQLAHAVGIPVLAPIVRALKKGEQLDARYAAAASFVGPEPLVREVLGAFSEPLRTDIARRVLREGTAEPRQPILLVMQYVDLVPGVVDDVIALVLLPRHARLLTDYDTTEALKHAAKSGPAAAKALRAAKLPRFN